MRSLTERYLPKIENRKLGSILKGQWALTKKYPKQTRGNIVGIIIGVLPGAGATWRPGSATPWPSASRRRRRSSVRAIRKG